MVRGLIVKYRVLDDWINKERQTDSVCLLTVINYSYYFLGWSIL